VTSEGGNVTRGFEDFLRVVTRNSSPSLIESSLQKTRQRADDDAEGFAAKVTDTGDTRHVARLDLFVDHDSTAETQPDSLGVTSFFSVGTNCTRHFRRLRAAFVCDVGPVNVTAVCVRVEAKACPPNYLPLLFPRFVLCFSDFNGVLIAAPLRHYHRLQTPWFRPGPNGKRTTNDSAQTPRFHSGTSCALVQRLAPA